MASLDEQRKPGLRGRRIVPQREPIQRLSDTDLECELTIAACAPGRLRFERYQHLLQERRRRCVAA